MKYWKETVILVLVICCFVSIRSCSVSKALHKADKQLLENARDSAFSVARQVITKNGELVAQVNTHEVTIEQLETYSGGLKFNLDRSKKEIGRLSNLVGFWKVKAEKRDTFRIVGRDTVIVEKGQEVVVKTFDYNDNYLKLHQLYDPHSSVLLTSYSYNTSFTLTAFRKGGGLFNKGQLMTNIKFDDPHIQTSTINSIVIKEGPVKFYQTRLFTFGLGFSLGVAGTVYLITQL